MLLRKIDDADVSRPARGGWIEICRAGHPGHPGQSRPARGGWIEIPARLDEELRFESRPARGGWIEISVL